MDYRATIDYLFSRLPMFSRQGAAAYKKDLHNIRALCAALGNPQDSFRSIHVAGTNGKGSVSHMLAATLQESGYKTGLYTSPHLYDFRERIRIDGKEISEDYVVRFTEKTQHLIESIEPSFFEVSVAMAFCYFAEEDVDVAVIEAGLGGRLDSTNIITPELSVITNIGWDHTNLLGDTLEAIAAEKAGIIKQAVPVVIGSSHEKTMPVFKQHAADANSWLHRAPDHYGVLSMRAERGSAVMAVQHKQSGSVETYTLDLPGMYQQQNICTVLTAIDVLRDSGFGLPGLAVKNALAHTKKMTGLKGRWEQLRSEPALILEVAHNEDGIRAMTEQLRSEPYQNLHIVFGMVKDKDPRQLLSSLPKKATYYFTQAAIPRALPVKDLLSAAIEEGLEGHSYTGVNEAAEAALAAAGKDDLVIVCGSIFLVAELDRERFAS